MCVFMCVSVCVYVCVCVCVCMCVLENCFSIGPCWLCILLWRTIVLGLIKLLEKLLALHHFLSDPIDLQYKGVILM